MGKKPGVPDRTGLGVELDEEAIAEHLPTDTPMWVLTPRQKFEQVPSFPSCLLIVL